MKPPVLLLYNLTGEAYQKTRLTAMRFRIRVRPVKAEEYGETLAALCDMEPMKNQPQPEVCFQDEMLVMAHFTGMLASQFLTALKKQGVKPIVLKAMLTETNSTWNSVTLHNEIAAEHEAMTREKAPVHEAGEE